MNSHIAPPAHVAELLVKVIVVLSLRIKHLHFQHCFFSEDFALKCESRRRTEKHCCATVVFNSTVYELHISLGKIMLV